MSAGHDLLQDLGRRVGGEQALAGQDLEEDRAEGEDVAPLVGPHLDHHLGGHVGGLAGQVGLAGAAPRRDPEVDQLDRALGGHHDVARAHVAVHDAGLLEDVLEAAADAARDEDGELHVGQAAERPVTLEVLDEAPAVDVLEDDAELPVHPLEVEDPADVLVVQHRVATRLLHEEAEVLRVRVPDLLDDDRTLEAGLPEEQPLAHGAHAAGAQLMEDAVLRLGQTRAPPGPGEDCRAPRGCQGERAGRNGPDAILAAVRLLALDVGDVRIGVALSDETGTLASGLATLRAVGPRKDAQAVAALVREHGVDEVVVGLPLRLDGSLGPQGEKVMGFVERLRRVLRVPVVTRDERLTSVAADERLAEAGVKRRDRKARLDQAAATLILQEHLDERKAVPVRGGASR